MVLDKSKLTPTGLDYPTEGPICPRCKGARTVRPLFYASICPHCHGVGYLDAETGLPFSLEEAADLLARRSLAQDQTIKEQRKTMARELSADPRARDAGWRR